jgi:hypothetical protein
LVVVAVGITPASVVLDALVLTPSVAQHDLPSLVRDAIVTDAVALQASPSLVKDAVVTDAFALQASPLVINAACCFAPEGQVPPASAAACTLGVKTAFCAIDVFVPISSAQHELSPPDVKMACVGWLCAVSVVQNVPEAYAVNPANPTTTEPARMAVLMLIMMMLLLLRWNRLYLCLLV